MTESLGNKRSWSGVSGPIRYRFGDGTCEIDQLTPIYAQDARLPPSLSRNATAAEFDFSWSSTPRVASGGRESTRRSNGL